MSLNEVQWVLLKGASCRDSPPLCLPRVPRAPQVAQAQPPPEPPKIIPRPVPELLPRMASVTPGRVRRGGDAQARSSGGPLEGGQAPAQGLADGRVRCYRSHGRSAGILLQGVEPGLLWCPNGWVSGGINLYVLVL